jgi:hypothetical protein
MIDLNPLEFVLDWGVQTSRVSDVLVVVPSAEQAAPPKVDTMQLRSGLPTRNITSLGLDDESPHQLAPMCSTQ